MVRDQLSVEQVIAQLRPEPPAVLGISLYSYNLGASYATIRALKRAFPDLHLCVGGPHVNIFPRETLSLEGIDSIVLGDGEQPFLELCDRVVRDGRLAGELPPGVYTAEAAAGAAPLLPYELPSLDDLPVPDLTLLDDHTRYRDFLSGRVMGLLASSRGCPFRCFYCRSERSRYRAYSLEYIGRCLRHYQRMGVEYVEFWDETFNSSIARLRAIAELFERERYGLRWAIRGAVVTNAPFEVLARLRATGLGLIQFGVETSVPRLLEALNKRISAASIQAAFAASQRAGLRTVCNLMINVPTQTRREIEHDLALVRALAPTYVSISIYNWAPDTTLYARALETGALREDFWRRYAERPVGAEPVVHAETEVPVAEVYRMRDRFLRRYYFNPGYVARYVRRMEARELWRAASIAALMARGQLLARLRG